MLTHHRRSLALVALVAIPSPAHATPPRPTRILVLPAAHDTEVEAVVAAQFAARVLVALHEAPRLSATTPQDLDDLIAAQRLQDLLGCSREDCVAVLADAAGADRVLSTRVVATRGGFSAFLALHDVTSGTTVRRREVPDLRRVDAGVAREIADWVGGARIRRHATVAVTVGGDAPPGKAEALAGAVESAITNIERVRTSTNEMASHIAEIEVTTLEVVRQRHHVHRYLDGTLVATLRLRHRASGTTVLTRQVRISASQRARFSTPDRVVAELCSQAAHTWAAAMRANAPF